MGNDIMVNVESIKPSGLFYVAGPKRYSDVHLRHIYMDPTCIRFVTMSHASQQTMYVSRESTNIIMGNPLSNRNNVHQW